MTKQEKIVVSAYTGVLMYDLYELIFLWPYATMTLYTFKEVLRSWPRKSKVELSLLRRKSNPLYGRG